MQLRDSNVALVLDRTVPATSGTGTRGTWSLNLDWSYARLGDGELKAFAASPKGGTPVDVITAPIVIAP